MTVSNLLTSTVLRIEKRPRTSFLGQVLAIVVALTASLAVSALLIRITGADVEGAFVALYKGAFGSRRAIIETLVRAAPLILTGLSATLAFRAYIWNIGIEGQLFAGAMAAYWVYTVLGWLPPVPLFLLIVLSGFVGGAIWGWIPGLLQNRFNVDIIISTVMSNYIATYLLSYMLSGAGPWREPGSYYQQSGQLAESAHYPLLVPDTRLHMGFAIGLIAAVSIYILLQRTPLGYEIRAVGSNPLASRLKGANLSKILIIVMLVSGGLAGLVGAGELFGVQHRLRLDISPGYGFTGMLVAMLAGLNPLIVIVVAIFFGSLNNGAIQMQIVTHVPTALADAIQAIVLLFLLSAQTIARYRIRRIRSDE